MEVSYPSDTGLIFTTELTDSGETVDALATDAREAWVRDQMARQGLSSVVNVFAMTNTCEHSNLNIGASKRRDEH